MKDFDLGSVQSSNAGLDAFFENEPQVVSPVGAVKPKTSSMMRVGSLQQLQPFQRVSAETLVNKSTQDLWALRKSQNGEFFIERLFDEKGAPLKG
jgi:hypothetical protein